MSRWELFLVVGSIPVSSVALMANQIGRQVSTFSIGFEEPAYNELPYAGIVAKHFGTDDHELIVGPQSCDLIERLVGVTLMSRLAMPRLFRCITYRSWRRNR